MKHVVTPLFISLMLAAGWAQSQPATGDVRESTDPSRAAEVEQKAQRLGDTVSPAEQSGGAATQGGASSGSSGAGTGATGSPTGTEDMSGAQKPYGSSTGTEDTSGAPAASPGASDSTSGTSGTSGSTSPAPGNTGKSSGGNLKSGPAPGEMGGTQQLERPQEQRFTEPTQPAR